MRLPVPLQHVRALLVVDVAYGCTCIGRDVLAREPGVICMAEGVGREGGEVGRGEERVRAGDHRAIA